MAGAAALQRMKLERRLAFLATLGNTPPSSASSAPSSRRHGLRRPRPTSERGRADRAAAGAPSRHGELGEALVATAVGIGVAIPAVAANTCSSG